MIRRYYALPEAEKGCNAAHLIGYGFDGQLWATLQFGTATVSPEMVVDPETYQRDPDVAQKAESVADKDHFVAWYGEHQKDPADWEGQQLVSGLLYYLWLQRKDQLPNE